MRGDSTFKQKRDVEGMKILSFGGGVNSTAILCLKLQGKYDFDAMIFANTGGELPETYDYLEKVVKPLCREYNIPFHIVSFGSLYDDYFEKKIIPYRIIRSCTDKYKIRIMHKFIKEKYGEDITWIIGIDYGEKERASRFNGEFPLIDRGIDRNGCKKIISSYDLPIPHKSGCFFCPFTSLDGWIELFENHKELFLKAEAFEKNSRNYPTFCLNNIPLERIRRSLEEHPREKQTLLSEFVEAEEKQCIICMT